MVHVVAIITFYLAETKVDLNSILRDLGWSRMIDESPKNGML
jgi:hypothetical protein